MGKTKEVAVITGASRGIGKAIALALAKDGYNIAFSYNNSAKMANELVVELEQEFGVSVFCQKSDVSMPDEVDSFFEEIKSRFDTISCVVNNAGITSDKPLSIMNIQTWRSVIDTNLTGAFNVCKASSKAFIQQKKGSIVNISSITGIDGNAGQANYAASKAGLIGLTKTLAKEFGRYNVTVNCIAPGLIETDMIHGSMQQTPDAIASKILLRRIGTSEEVANLVSFICSPKARYITGQVIRIDGGLIN